MAFGDVIAARRKELDLTQKELARVIAKEDGEAISPQYLNDLERNRRNPPGEHLLKEFAKHLQLDEEYLLFVAGEWPEDLRDGSVPPDRVRAAFRAFRREVRRG